MWLESANENVLLVVMERTVIRVGGGPTEDTHSSHLKANLSSICCPLVLWQVSPVCPVSDCPEGRFGIGCVHPCNCTGAPCDKVTGQCKCPAGTSGKHCENCECILIFYFFNLKQLSCFKNWHDHNFDNVNLFHSVSGGFLGSRLHRNLPSLWEWRRVWQTQRVM